MDGKGEGKLNRTEGCACGLANRAWGGGEVRVPTSEPISD